MAAKNTDLNAAKRAKNDEFYTQRGDIEDELHYYRSHFKDQVVYCNCDDPRVSEFTRYFIVNFEFLGLRKLIATCYKSRNPDLFSRNDAEQAVGLVVTQSTLQNGGQVVPLNGDGDFRSAECVQFLDEADIVVTNPPFSLFREYVAQLIKHDKKFLIVGSKNAITYKEIFPLIKSNQLWLGINPNGRDMLFDVPDDYANSLRATAKEGSAYRIVNGVIKGRLGNAAWYTNLTHHRRSEELRLYRRYNPTDYPTYDNYDAINVDKVAKIPEDYAGAMGVPITFLDKYNPEQFEILGSNRGVNQDPNGVYGRGSTLDGKEVFKRIFIRNKRL